MQMYCSWLVSTSASSTFCHITAAASVGKISPFPHFSVWTRRQQLKPVVFFQTWNTWDQTLNLLPASGNLIPSVSQQFCNCHLHWWLPSICLGTAERVEVAVMSSLDALSGSWLWPKQQSDLISSFSGIKIDLEYTVRNKIEIVMWLKPTAAYWKWFHVQTVGSFTRLLLLFVQGLLFGLFFLKCHISETNDY